jgi:RND family efflux transporter MFP subunit
MLGEESVIPKPIVEDATSDLAAQTANSSAAKTRLRQATLWAPSAGVVSRRLAQPGDVVAGGSPVVVIEDSDALIVRGGSTYDQIALLVPGLAVDIQFEQGPAKKGHLSRVAPSPDPANGLYEFQVVPDAVDADWRPGRIARVRIEAALPKPLVRVPLQALISRGGADSVMVAVREDRHLRARLRHVELEYSEGSNALVRRGIEAGEWIVLDGASMIQEGELLSPASLGEPAEATVERGAWSVR